MLLNTTTGLLLLFHVLITIRITLVGIHHRRFVVDSLSTERRLWWLLLWTTREWTRRCRIVTLLLLLMLLTTVDTLGWTVRLTARGCARRGRRCGNFHVLLSRALAFMSIRTFFVCLFLIYIFNFDYPILARLLFSFNRFQFLFVDILFKYY